MNVASRDDLPRELGEERIETQAVDRGFPSSLFTYRVSLVTNPHQIDQKSQIVY
jgi:hypothetical protein